MKKHIALAALATCLFMVIGQAQEKKGLFKKRNQAKEEKEYKIKDVQVDFLLSYYSQDGDHGAVTGGIGTEQLTDVTPTWIITVPLDSTQTLTFDIGVDYYTSASTDNIDFNVSSASSKDIRAHGNISYQKENKETGWLWGVNVSGSGEYDYTSFGGGFNVAKSFNNNNSEIGFKANALFDSWSLIYPAELRFQQWFDSRTRNSVSASLTWSQVWNRKLQTAVTADLITQSGLLSTPFHRVYFQGSNDATVEILPSNRLKTPIGMRINYYPTDALILRGYYRYYSDDWGLTAHTASLEVPIKINPFFSVYPFFRYHTQTAADHFAPYQQNLATQEFYTSDYDLSKFTSTQYGAGIRYAPPTGIAKFKLPWNRVQRQLKSVDLRFGLYDRSDGLNAWIGSVGFSFTPY